MKRILAAIIVFILSTGLWGCGAQEKSQFDEATNQVVSVHGISFQIPKAWTKVVEDKDNLQYADQKTGKFKHYIAVMFQDGDKISDALEQLQYRTEDGIDLKNYKQSSTIIANMSAINVEYYRIIKDTKYMYKEIILETDKGVVIIIFFSRDQVGLADFDKVTETIKAD